MGGKAIERFLGMVSHLEERKILFLVVMLGTKESVLDLDSERQRES